jgi:hypothetical protein
MLEDGIIGLALSALYMDGYILRGRLIDLAFARLGAGYERIEQSSCRQSHLIDGTIKRSLVRARRLVETRKFSHKLKRSIPYLFVGGRRVKIEEGLDVSTHNVSS